MTGISQFDEPIPTMLFYSWICDKSNNPKPDDFLCKDTFLFYISNNTYSRTLGVQVHIHQFVQSLYEVLKLSRNEPMYLMKLFTDVRDYYFNCPDTSETRHYDPTAIFYTKNTIRYPQGFI